jgi:hypothetical protein
VANTGRVYEFKGMVFKGFTIQHMATMIYNKCIMVGILLAEKTLLKSRYVKR